MVGGTPADDPLAVIGRDCAAVARIIFVGSSPVRGILCRNLDSGCVVCFTTYMKFTATDGDEMTAQEMIEKATKLENSADMLNCSLLAWSMAEQAMRDEAKELREKAAGC